MSQTLSIILLLLSGCGLVERTAPADKSAMQLVAEAQERRLAKLPKDPPGWLIDSDCDSALWSYTAAAFAGCKGFNPRANEYPGEPGRFARKPDRACWTKEAGDQGSKTTWSHDMGLALIIYGWECKDLALLEDHASYGFGNKWIMGEGEEGYILERAFYRPSMRGALYSAIYALGGENDAQKLWPSTYTSGLTDFQAHLQVLSIYLRSDMALRGEGDAVPRPPEDGQLTLDISNIMFDRLKEHATRDPKDPLFQVLYGMYSGNVTEAVNLCSKDYLPTEYVGEYVRCGDHYEKCQLSHLIKSCGILLKEYGQ